MKEGQMRSSTTRKKGISLTLDESVLKWLEKTAYREALSVSYLVNRFCSIAKDSLNTNDAFPGRSKLGEDIKRRGLK